MKNLILLLFFFLFLFNTNIFAQQKEYEQLKNQIFPIAEKFAFKILEKDKIEIEYHNTYYNIDDTPNSYVFTCNYMENGIKRILTLNLSAESPYSLISFYFDNPIDTKAKIEYQKIIISNQGIFFKTNDEIFKRFPDYVVFTKNELIKNPTPKVNTSKSALLNNRIKSFTKAQTDSIEFKVENVPNYNWYLNCALTVEMMYYGYWNDRGYPTLIPGGDSQNGFFWAVGEESCFYGEISFPRLNYYAQAAEYGNNISSEGISAVDKTWDSYKNLIDTYNAPVYVGWSGEPYGAHATLGIGYKIIDTLKYFILHDTWYSTPSYVSYNQYSESVSGYLYWHPTSDPNNESNNSQNNNIELSDSEINLYSKEVTFNPALKPQTEAYHHFELADLNGDNKNDFIICNFRNYSGLKLLLYYYDGENYILDQNFNPSFDGFECLNVSKTFDFDNDGDLDILVTGYWSKVRIFVNNGGTIDPNPIVIDDKGRGFIDIDYGDFDNDGDLDIMASTVDGQIRIYRNNNGTFNQIEELNTGGQSFKIRFVDINNDNYLDLIASKRNGTVVIYNNNNGSFLDNPTFSPSGHGGMSFDCGDIDNDGWKDIVTVNDGQLIIYKNVNGSFTDNPEIINSPECFPKDISLNDLNGGHYPDLIVGSFNRPNFILKNIQGIFSENPSWISQNVDPSFSINIFNDSTTNKKLLVFGKSRGGNIEFFQTNITDTINIIASLNPSEGGTVSGDGNYKYGDTCRLTVSTNTGYNFVNWTENGIQVSTDVNYSFEVTADRALIANFEKITNVTDLNDNSNFTIYPNPTTGKITIEGENIRLINVLNLNGQVIKHLSPKTNDKTIDLNNLSKGVYLIIISTKDKTITKKVIFD